MNLWVKTLWCWIRWPLAVALVLFIGLSIYFIYSGRDKVLTDEAVARIHASHLTRQDVFGPLPPAPDPKLNDETLAGIDTNNNGIRDDVEIAIYNAHKDSATTTAAMLQYAKELQMEFTQVFNSATLVAVMQEEGRGFLCIGDSRRRTDVKNLVFNTQQRKDWQEKIRDEYMIGYKVLQIPSCDISS